MEPDGNLLKYTRSELRQLKREWQLVLAGEMVPLEVVLADLEELGRQYRRDRGEPRQF